MNPEILFERYWNANSEGWYASTECWYIPARVTKTEELLEYFSPEGLNRYKEMP